MSKRNGGPPAYTVSGPGVDLTCEHDTLAVVRAQAAALAAEGEATYYVRGSEGQALVRVERTREGTVLTTRVAP